MNDQRRLRSPAALGHGLVDGFVYLLVVVVLVAGVLPHVRFERRRMTAHVAAEGTPGGEREGRVSGRERI